jgi:hypothetical protein
MVKMRGAIYAAACLITLTVAALFILEPALNSRYIKDRIATFIEKKTGAVLRPEQMVFTVFPHPGMQLQAADLPLTRAMGIHINAMQIQLDMGQLLRGRVMASKILLQDMDIRFTPDADATRESFQNAFSFQFPQNQVTRLFALLADNQKNIELILQNGNTSFFTSLDGTLILSQSDQTIQCNMRIRDIHIKKKEIPQFFPYENFPLDTLASSGAHLQIQLNAQSGFTGNLTMEQFLIRSDQLPDKVIAGKSLNLVFNGSNEQLSLHLEPVHLDYPAARVSIEFSDDRTRQKTAVIFSGNDIDMAQARQVSLAIAPKNAVVSQLFDILHQGTASSVSVKFQGKSVRSLFDPKQMMLTGSAEHAVIKIPETQIFTTDVNGSAQITKGVLEITAHQGKVGNSRIRQGQLDIDLMNHKDIPFTGTFDLNVDLSEVPGILISLLPDTLLARELDRVSQVQGQVDTRLDLGKKKGQKKLTVSVAADPFSGTGYYDRIPFPIRISNGRFAYADNQIFLTDFSGRIGTNPLTGVTAQVDLTTNAWVTLSAKTFDVSIADILSWDRFLEEVKAFMGSVSHGQGRLLFDQLSFEGPALEPDQWTWNLSGSGHDIQAGMSPASREIQHLSGRFTLSEASISTKDLTAVISDLTWLSHVLESEQAAGIAMPLTLENGTIHISKESSSIVGSLLFASNARLSVELKGNTLQDLKPQKVMLKDDGLTDAMIMVTEDTDRPLVRFEGYLDTRTLFAMTVTDSLLHKQLVALNGGVPIKIHTDNRSKLHIDTQQLYLEPLVSVLDKKKIPKYRLLPDQTPVGLTAGSIVYHNYTFSDIAAVVAYDLQTTDIQLVFADLCGLTISGHTALGLANPGIQGTGHATIQTTDKKNLEPVLSCLFPDRHLMDGSYSFVANLTAEGSVQSFQKNLNGRITFTSRNGRIYKMTLISRLLSVLNILNLPDMTQKGFKYRSFLVEAKVNEGVIHLEKAVIDAENMALIFSGRISPFENSLDLTCLVAPFKTIDTIIKYIPVVNTILSGRLVSFPAKATGTIADPVITPLHPSAVGEGLMNLLTDIIKSPGRLLEKVP